MFGIIEGINEFRPPATTGYNPVNYVELNGGKSVEIWFYEPNPNTFRSKYYYNSRLNTLYMKIPYECPNGVIGNVWRAVST